MPITSDEIAKRLRDCFRTVFPDLTDEQINSASQETVTAWDSLAAVALFATVGQEFGIELDLDKLGELNSFARFETGIENELRTR